MPSPGTPGPSTGDSRSGMIRRNAGKNAGVAAWKATLRARQFEAALGNAAMERFGLVPVQAEDLHHQAADALVTPLEKHQDGRTGAAQGAAQQARRAQAQDLVQARHQRF